MRASTAVQGLVFTLAIADDVPGRVIGDAARVRQILFNLVANAIKFTPEGRVAVAVRLGPAQSPNSNSTSATPVSASNRPISHASSVPSHRSTHQRHARSAGLDSDSPPAMNSPA